MSTPVVTTTLNFLPAAVGDSATLGPDTTPGVKRVYINGINALAGGLYTISCQKIQVSGGAYTETASSRSFSNAITPTAAPSEGYAPLVATEAEASVYGYQAVITLVSGTLPTSAVVFTLESL
jgi:hypothetical protein